MYTIETEEILQTSTANHTVTVADVNCQLITEFKPALLGRWQSGARLSLLSWDGSKPLHISWLKKRVHLPLEVQGVGLAWA